MHPSACAGYVDRPPWRTTLTTRTRSHSQTLRKRSRRSPTFARHLKTRNATQDPNTTFLHHQTGPAPRSPKRTRIPWSCIHSRTLQPSHHQFVSIYTHAWTVFDRCSIHIIISLELPLFVLLLSLIIVWFVSQSLFLCYIVVSLNLFFALGLDCCQHLTHANHSSCSRRLHLVVSNLCDPVFILFLFLFYFPAAVLSSLSKRCPSGCSRCCLRSRTHGVYTDNRPISPTFYPTTLS